MGLLINLIQFSDLGLLILRVTIGVIFLSHGIPKLKMLKMQPSGQMPFSMLSLFRFLSIVEPIGAGALILGFLTKWAALGLAFIMVGAIYFKIVKWHKNFTGPDGWELDLILLASNLALFFLGGGILSLDWFLKWYLITLIP